MYPHPSGKTVSACKNINLSERATDTPKLREVERLRLPTKYTRKDSNLLSQLTESIISDERIDDDYNFNSWYVLTMDGF
jgi:hypothetical protein